jgi:glycosyltransferase involved in cell wall biosynthesis
MLRILQVHNTYQQAGGEDAVVANEGALLSGRGHDVRLWSANNDEIEGAWAKLKTAWQVPYSHEARRDLAEAIAEFKPDVVHVHNFFPLLTPSIYDACRSAGVPVVQTLHNFRTICAGALLLRDGRPCEDCIGASPYQGALHGCYRGSRLGSLAVARMISRHRRQGTWQTKVDRFIALTDFAKAKFVEAGFPADKISVKPNFAVNLETRHVETARSGALFVGRLSMEKGIGTLLKAWRGLDVPLRIAGDGPLMSIVRGAGTLNVAPLGTLPPDAVSQEMARAAFLVMPSEWYETFGMVIIEAFCHGLPVIASRLGAMAEIVEDGVTGLAFTPGDPEDLSVKVRWASEHSEEMLEMGRTARRIYEAKYTPEVNYGQLFAVYEDAIRQNPAAPAPC